MENEEHITAETAQELDESKEVENMKKIEAALFLSARYLTLQDLVMLTDVNPLMIRELIERLIKKYNSDESAIDIVVKEDMWKMDVGQEYVSMINKLATGSAEFSKTEQETLAVIAYKQPVKQSVIIKIRGNKSYEHIKYFIDIGLVQAKKDGRTKELKLSDDFFEYFHLQNQNKILDDHSSSNKEEFGDLQKKGDGSEEIIGIEKIEESSEKESSETSKIVEKQEQSRTTDINKNLSSDDIEIEEKTEEEKAEEKQVKEEIVEQQATAEEKEQAIDEEKEQATAEEKEQAIDEEKEQAIDEENVEKEKQENVEKKESEKKEEEVIGEG